MHCTSLAILCLTLTGSLGLKVANNSPPETERGSQVFYAVVMGKLAYRHQVSLWLSSIRLLGKFTGEAVIATDKPVCLSRTLAEAQLLGDLVHSDDHVDIYAPNPEKYKDMGNIHIVKRPEARTINKMKLEKARAWANMGVARVPHKISSIIYTDEDIVIAKDLRSFLLQIRQLETQGHTLALFRDTGKSAGELHTGIVAIFPGAATNRCLREWGKKLTGLDVGPTLEGEDQLFEADDKRSKAAERVAAMKRKAETAKKWSDQAQYYLKKYPKDEKTIEAAKVRLQNLEDANKALAEAQKALDAVDASIAEWSKKVGITGKIAPALRANVEETWADSIQESMDAVMEAGFEAMAAKLEMDSMGPDQQALGHTRICKRTPDGGIRGIKILPKPFFWLPTPGGLHKGKQVEFVHFTNTGRWKLISHGAIRKYLTEIGIPEEIDPTGRVKDKTCSDA
eukprot:gnl/MRDRNA2_/MRDRNA2_85493_c1_seq1.p1 gnl/MRDRNA2_/MRDRNA2_85493_c1~~gnl/MRDRNA2_/MRDRNA2_85493_c1_seq1.p1  ORF type:complete len:454 (+),score=111.75 gnl/MRDRNA2_/MRDRNA2_85493_c1_seq1:100-1461(+)